MILKRYKQFGGANPETAGLAHLLAYEGVVSPHDKKPLSETMLLGIAGGIGGGYWLFEFGDEANVFIGARHLWQSPKPYLEEACKRLGVQPTFQETGGVKAAEKHLRDALDAGHPALVWVDLANMPYALLPKNLSGMVYHYVVAYGIDDATVYVADRAPKGLTVTLKEFAAARSRISASKNRLLTVAKPAKPIPLEAAIIDGIRACYRDLNNPKIGNFGLPAFAKWAGLVNNTKDKKGWPKVFAAGNAHFYNALRWSFTCIDVYQTPGAAFRGMYADFLAEAGEITGIRDLSGVASQYRLLASEWKELAKAFLPDASPPLKQLRELLIKKDKLFEDPGAEGIEQRRKTSEELEALQQSFFTQPPLTASDRAALFADLEIRIGRIHAAEVEACNALQGAIA